MWKKLKASKKTIIIAILIISMIAISISLVLRYTNMMVNNLASEYHEYLSIMDSMKIDILRRSAIKIINDIVFYVFIVFAIGAISFAYILIMNSNYRLMKKMKVIQDDLKEVLQDNEEIRFLENTNGVERKIDDMILSINEYKKKISHYSKYDDLTGLMNRVTFISELDKEIERNAKGEIVLIYINLDGFSYYNNNFGYHKGDEILKLVATSISDFVHNKDIVSRIGGDEFTILMRTGNIDKESVSGYVESLLQQINSIKGSGVGGFISASIGVCIKTQKDQTAATMMNNAYLAMTTIKERQKNSYEFFINKNKKDITLDMIERALKKGDIQVHYQPKVNLKTNEIDGVEALVRWFDDVHGYISPFSFIKVAESTGYIITLGEWIMNRALSDIAELNRSLGTNISVAVNVSPIQFLQKRFLGIVSDALENSGMDAGNLEIELTEGIGLFNSPDVVQKFENISKLGISIAIDDFGTGYSSIKYLKEFKINTIKIDRSFINQCEKNRNIVRYIIEVSKTLGFKVVAEGVEDYMQARMLKDLDCDYIQGYFFYKPMPLVRLKEFVK